MSGQRGRHAEFSSFIAASPSFPSGPLSLPQVGCPQPRTKPQLNYTRDLPTHSGFLRVFYYNVTLRHKPTPNQHHRLSFSHFFPISYQCFIKCYDPLNSMTLYLPISAPFLPPPLSSVPLTTRCNKVRQVTITSSAPRFYPSTPALPESKKEDSSIFFF